MKVDILTIFPDIFEEYFEYSIVGKAQEKGIFEVEAHDLRQWATDKHKTVDDTPYGGGPGMVLKAEPIYRGLKDLQKDTKKSNSILTSARGKLFNQKYVKELAELDQLVFVCGRYEGIDERVSEFVDHELSIGPYVTQGGELPTLVMIEAISRYVPDVLGNPDSLRDTVYPQYTRPDKLETDEGTFEVPEVLLSGDHKKIKEWRKKHSQKPEDVLKEE